MYARMVKLPSNFPSPLCACVASPLPALSTQSAWFPTPRLIPTEFLPLRNISCYLLMLVGYWSRENLFMNVLILFTKQHRKYSHRKVTFKEIRACCQEREKRFLIMDRNGMNNLLHAHSSLKKIVIMEKKNCPNCLAGLN